MPAFKFFNTLVILFFLSACQSVTPRFADLPPLEVPKEAYGYRAFIEGQLRLEAGEFADAARLFAAAAEADPKNSSLVLAQTEALLRAGDDSSALGVINTALLSSPKNTEFLFFLGNYHFARDENSQAIPYFQEIYDLDPNIENSAFHLVLAVVREGDLPRATQLLIEILARQPEYPAAELMLARVYREQGDFVAAEKVLLRLEKREPQLDTPAIELGALFEGQKEWEKALGYYRTAVNLNPENITLRHHMARIYIQQNDYASALGEFSEILLQDPGNIEARRKTGLIYLDQKEYSRAIPVFKSLIESVPELDEVRFYLGTAYERQGDPEQAMPHFEAVSERSEIYNDALMHRVFILQKQQRLEEATDLLETRLSRNEAPPESYFYLASLYDMRKIDTAVLDVLRRISENFGGDSEVVYRLGLVYDRFDDTKMAIEEMRRTITLNPDHAEALNYLAYFYAEKGENLDEALSMAQRALSLKLEPHILDTLGWIWYRRGDFDQAGKFLLQALDKAGSDPVIHEHYGDLLRAKGAWKEAMIHYQLSLDLQPDNPVLREKLKALTTLKGNG